MRRRDFLGVLGSAAATWPLQVRAQQPVMPVIGFLNAALPGPFAHLVTSFRQSLEKAGFVEGQNVAIEYRWAEGRFERLSGLADELVRRQVTVIVAIPTLAARAAKASTTTIPIVFVSAMDPVALGLVASLNRPGGNATGMATINLELEPKRLGLLLSAVPNATVIAMLTNPTNPYFDVALKDMREAARRAGVQLTVVTASVETDFEPAFATLVQQRANALVIGSDAFFIARHDRIVAMAERHAVPAIYTSREAAHAGGLMSYGPSLPNIYREVAGYTARILKGAKPSDLPVVQPTKFEFVINLKTAKTLGLEFPRGLVLAADEVIE